MKFENTYPPKNRRKVQREDIIGWAKWPFLFTAYICPILNIYIGGPAWSIVVLWSLWMVWTMVVSPDLVEYNRISQVIKGIFRACVLLVLIDWCLAPGWAVEVVSIVCFGGLVCVGTLFFTDITRQKQNMMPMLYLIAGTLFFCVAGLIFWKSEGSWEIVLMGALAFALLVACFGVLGGDLIAELRKRFHVQ